MEGEEGSEQESCGVPRATSLRIPVGRSLDAGSRLASPQAGGETRAFPKCLVPCFRHVELRRSKASFRGASTPGSQMEPRAPAQASLLPLQRQRRALARGACCYNQHNLPCPAPQGRAHIPPYQCVCTTQRVLSGARALVCGPGGGPSCRAAARAAFWPDKGVSEGLGRCYGLVGGGGEQLP